MSAWRKMSSWKFIKKEMQFVENFILSAKKQQQREEKQKRGKKSYKLFRVECHMFSLSIRVSINPEGAFSHFPIDMNPLDSTTIQFGVTSTHVTCWRIEIFFIIIQCGVKFIIIIERPIGILVHHWIFFNQTAAFNFKVQLIFMFNMLCDLYTYLRINGDILTDNWISHFLSLSHLIFHFILIEFFSTCKLNKLRGDDWNCCENMQAN